MPDASQLPNRCFCSLRAHSSLLFLMPEFLLETHPSGYFLSTDPARLDITAIHRWLSEESYWARNIPRATMERAIANSLNFGLYAPDGQLAGFCRVVTDRATFAWLCDVFVLPAHRGHGLSKWLVRQMLAHPDLQNLRRHLLAGAHCSKGDGPQTIAHGKNPFEISGHVPA